MPPPRTFWCFISYRHADNKEPGRQWATWLHQALETYEVPADLVSRANARGDVIPDRIYPVFRDEEELPADAELSRPIESALQNSRYLVVLCSPAAVESRFVADEILRFKQLGKQDSILAAIIAGEPNASDDPAKAHLEECFPRPLRFRVDGAGLLTAERCEPIAADFRLHDGTPGWTSPAGYRESLQQQGTPKPRIDALVAGYAKQQHLMLLKIVAGTLGVPLGELTKRDQAYQLVLQQRRARVLRRWLSIVTALAIAAAGAGWLAYRNGVGYRQQRDVADQKANESRGRLIRTMFERARSEQRAGRPSAAIPWMLEAARLDSERPSPTSRFNVSRIVGMLTAVPRPLQVAFHDSRVNHVGQSPDGKRLVTASEDYTARIWDIATGQPVGAVMEHDDPVLHATFSPDGRLVVTAAGDVTGRRGAGSARVWDAATGAPVTPPLRHAGRSKREAGVEGRKGTPASDYVISHGGAVTRAIFSPDGALVVSAGDDKAARLWSVADGRPRGEPLAHKDDVVAVAFHPDGGLLATADRSGRFYLWDLETGRRVPIRDHAATDEPAEDGNDEEEGEESARVHHVAFSPDGTRLLTAGHRVRVWSVAERRLEQEIPVEMFGKWQHLHAAFSPDGTLLAVQTSANALRLWDLEEEYWSWPFVPIEHDRLSRFAFSASGRLLATMGDGVRVWDPATRATVTDTLPYSRMRSELDAPSAAFSPDDRTIAVAGDREDAAVIWSLPAQRVVAFSSGLGEQDEFDVATTFSADGSLAVAHPRSVSVDGKAVRIWDAVSGEPLGDAIVSAGAVAGVAVSDRGGAVVIIHRDPAAGPDGFRVSIWRFRTRDVAGLTVDSEANDREPVVRFSPDGRMVAIACGTGGVEVRNLDDGTVLATLPHDRPVNSLSFSADGSRLATGGGAVHTFDPTATGFVQVWRLPAGTPVGPRLVSTGWIDQVDLDVEGGVVVATGGRPLPGAGAIFPPTVAIWDVETGRPLLGPEDRMEVDDDAIRRAGVECWGDGGGARLLRLASRKAIFTADSKVVAEPDAGRIALRDAATGRLLPTLPIAVAVKDSRAVPAMAFSPDGRLLAAVGQIDATGPSQLGVWDVATGDRFLPDMPIPVAGDEIQRLIFAPDSPRLQVECRTCVWHVPIALDAADVAPADLAADVELTTGMTIDRERDGTLAPVNLREAWRRRADHNDGR